MEGKNLNTTPTSYQLIESNDFTEEVTEGLAPRFIRPTVEAGIGYEFLEGTLEAIAKANWGLLNASDLVDKGVNTIPDYTIATTDICGNARPVGQKYDLGAYELGSGATGITTNQKEQSRFTLVANSNGVTVYGIEGLAKVNMYKKSLEPLRDKMGGVLRIKTESRPPGFVQVETEEGIVDASLDVQLDNLKKQLMALNSRE